MALVLVVVMVAMMDAVNKSIPGGEIRIGVLGYWVLGWDGAYIEGDFFYDWETSLGRGKNVIVNRVMRRKKGGTKRRTKRNNRESY